MKKNQIVLIVFMVFVLLLCVTSEVFCLDKTGSDLISNYKEALKTKNPDAIRAAYEALKVNKQAVKYMQKNLPKLNQQFNQRAFMDEMNLAHQQQAARGEIKEFKEIEGSKFGTKKKMPTTKAVSGDPDLANLAEPGRGHVKGPKGDPNLADLGKGKGGAQPSSGSSKTKYTGNTKISGDPAKTRLSGSRADTKYTGDTKLSGDPGKTKVSGQPKQNIGSKRVSGDPDLAKLVERTRAAEQAKAKAGVGASEPPPVTKVDRDPVRKAVREGRDAVRGGESPPKTKIDPVAKAAREAREAVRGGESPSASKIEPAAQKISDPDLAKLVERTRAAEQAKAKAGVGASEPPPVTKVDRDPVRKAVREGRDAVRGGESPPKTKIDPVAKAAREAREAVRGGESPSASKIEPAAQKISDPDLAKLVERTRAAEQAKAKAGVGASEPPPVTKVDRDPVRKAVREGRDAVRGGESPPKTKIDPVAKAAREGAGQAAAGGGETAPVIRDPQARAKADSEAFTRRVTEKLTDRGIPSSGSRTTGAGQAAAGGGETAPVIRDPQARAKADSEAFTRRVTEKLTDRGIPSSGSRTTGAGQAAAGGGETAPVIRDPQARAKADSEAFTRRVTEKLTDRGIPSSGSRASGVGQAATGGGTPSPSLLEGGKASTSYTPSRIAQLDQAVGGRIQEAVGMGEIPESSSKIRKGFTKHGDRAMGVLATAATAHEGYEAGHQIGEGWEARNKAKDYRERARKAREAGNITVADKLDKRAGEYEAEANQKISQGAVDEAWLVGTLGAAATATGGTALAGYGAYKTGEASYGAGKSLSERMIAEEYGREVANAQREGRAANDAYASANAKARIVGEVTGMRAGMERIMRDTDADQAAAEMGDKLKDRRDNAILGLDDGLHEINLIEQRMRDLDKNPNQDDPWVKQRRQELLDAYTAKRSELQGTHEALGAEAGAGDGEYIAIRGAVALIPEKPDYRRDEGEQIEEVADAILRDPDMEGEIEEVADAVLQEPGKEIDDLAAAMVDNQVTAEEQAQWQDQGAADPNSLAGEAVRGFTGTNPAGYTDTERDMHASTRVTWTPDEVKKKDIEEERRTAEEQERQANAQRANQQRIDDERFTNDWSSTIGAINESLSELNEQDAQKVKDMTEAAIELIKQMQNGTLSDEDFTSQMAVLENEHTNLQREGLEGWQRIRDRLIGDQVTPGGGSGNIPVGGNEADPCINDFTMNNNSELRCKCQGYTFDYSRARCVKTGVGSGTASAGATGGTPGSGNICPCVDENGRRYRVMFGQDCSMDLGMAGRDYDCSDDIIGGGGSATATGGSGGGATGRQGMMYRIQTPPYGGGDVCLTAEEAEGIRNAPNTVLFEPLGEPCIK